MYSYKANRRAAFCSERLFKRKLTGSEKSQGFPCYCTVFLVPLTLVPFAIIVSASLCPSGGRSFLRLPSSFRCFFPVPTAPSMSLFRCRLSIFSFFWFGLPFLFAPPVHFARRRYREYQPEQPHNLTTIDRAPAHVSVRYLFTTFRNSRKSVNAASHFPFTVDLRTEYCLASSSSLLSYKPLLFSKKDVSAALFFFFFFFFFNFSLSIYIVAGISRAS